MSGGVDSSVAAARLIEQGHKVTGLFMKNWEEDDDEEYCSAAEDLADAEEVCKLLGIELKTINFSHEYWNRVFQLFLEEYRSGRTPNPDVVCNKEIKFKEFLNWAMHLGADFIATGHYARIEKQNRHYMIKKGVDKGKDQSYFLHTLDQDALRYANFPLGEIEKEQVREQAKDLSLPIHDKKDSTGICFIGERRFSDFLARFLPSQSGKIKTLDGETIGEHRGAYYYTIGQRQGLGIGGDGEAWYVAEKDVKRNIVYVVQGHDHPALMKKIVLAEQLHWITGIPPILPTNCKAKTRYRQDEQNCVISMIGLNYTRVEFDFPQWAVTPGQSIVFYLDDVCLGGGIIRSALDA
jgi:tRNA-specific 2-thiouridylase